MCSGARVNVKQDSVGERLKIMTPMTKYGRRQSTRDRDGLANNTIIQAC